MWAGSYYLFDRPAHYTKDVRDNDSYDRCALAQWEE